MTAPSSPPVPSVDVTLRLGDREVDLATRVLVAGVVPSPRFGREGEVVATARAMAASGADLVDVSLPPRMVGPVARAVDAPIVVRVASIDQSLAAGRAGAAVVLVPAELVAELVAGLVERADGPGPVTAPAVVIDDLAGLAAARMVAERLAVPLALDSTRWSGAEAMAREAVGVAAGCRLIITNDVHRSRRVAEVMAAILAARRAADPPTTSDDREALP